MAGGALAIPTIIPSSVLGNVSGPAPSDRITVGCIGTGQRGNAVMGGFLGQKDAQVVAVCDVKSWCREGSQQRVNKHYQGKGCAAYKDFRELVARDDIDAVLVATADHWHVLTSIAAVRAKKDVYMEKPIGLSMEEAQTLRAEVNRNGRVFQFGTQQRSDGKFRLACEIARNEKIGKLHTVNVWSPGSSAGGDPTPAPVPEGLDYDFWLGPAPFKPYTKDRCSNSLWWFISDYALGFIAGWGIHPLDIALWGADEKLNSSVEVEGTGEFPTKGICDTALNWRVTFKYSNGLTLNFTGHPRPEEWTKRYKETTSHGTAFEGSEGWVHVRRGAVNSHPESMIQSKIGSGGIQLYKSNNHVRNFLDCVKSREKTVSPVEEAVRGEALCQVGEIAIRLKRKLKWDPKTERFLGDDEANRKLSKSMRIPWSLKA